MNFAKVAFGVLVALSASRFVPHPPNFTSLITLSFYIPAVFGLRYIPVVVISLLFTDLILGLHSTMIFTSGSVVLIGLISKYLNKSILFRIFGSLGGAAIFFLVSNFGVWVEGTYGYSIIGFINCYFMAIPFFGYSVVSTLIFSVLIETVYRFYQKFYIKIF